MTGKKYNNIASRVFNTALFLEPTYAKTAMSFLNDRLELAGIDWPAEPDTSNNEANERWKMREHESEDWLLRADGTAVVPISDTLFHGSSYALESSLGAGYNTISKNVEMALSDSGTKRLAFIFDSPGGEVQGCAACGTKIRDMLDASGLEAWAFSNESMYSAAMWLGVQSDRIILPKTAGNGSVGVVSTHVDYSERMKDEGVKVTFITSGDKKVVGNPYEQLSDEDFKAIQDRVMRFAGMFHEEVADRRGMSVDAVAGTEADIFIGSDAVDVGFADEVMDIEDFYYAFSQESSDTKIILSGESSMNSKELDALKAKAKTADDLQAQVDDLTTANADLTDKVGTLTADLKEVKTAATEQHERYVAVMESDEAVKKQDSAKSLLADEMFAAFSADQLKAQLSRMAVDESEEEDEDEKEDKDDADSEDENGEDAAAVLAAARKNTSETAEITNRGEGGDGSATTDFERDSNGKRKSGSYSSKVGSKEDERASMSISAQIVKANRSRKHI